MHSVSVALFSQHANQKKKRNISQIKSAHTSLTISACVSSALVSSGAEKTQKSSGSDHTGRDRAACIPAFLQIRPGKADYSDPFPSPFSSVGGGRWGIFLGLCGAVIWRCLFNTSKERVARGATWPCYPFLQLPGIAILFNICKCLSVLIMNKYKVLTFDMFLIYMCVCVGRGCVLFKTRQKTTVCVERPERCLSISYSCKVVAVAQSQFLACSYNCTLRQELWLSVKQIGLFLHLAPR